LDVRVLEQISAGVPLNHVLETICLGMESLAEGMRASVLLLEDGVRVRHGAAPHLPAEWTTWIDGRTIGPNEGSCGTAAFRKQPVVATDIATDPRWVKYKDAALKHGLRSGWSIPFFDGDGNVLGTFAMYYDRPRSPTVTQLGLAEHAGHLASVAVQRHRAQAAVAESEETARLIIDQALDANVVMDAGGLVRGWNARATAMFGWTAEEATGKLLAELIIPNRLRREHQNGLTRIAETGRGTIIGRRVEMPAVHRDGRELRVVLAITRIRRGDQTMFSAFIEDVTESHRTAAALRESERHLALIYDHVADVLFELQVDDGGYRFISVNPAFLSVTGLARQDILGKYVHELLPEPSRSLATAKYEEALRTRSTVRWEELTNFPAGPRLGEVTVTPVFGSQNRPTVLIGSVRDLTARRQMENEVRQLQKLEAIGRLSGGIAHDFNNILAVILGVGNMLLKDVTDTDLRNQLEEILEAGRRGATLTRQFLAFARKQVLQPQPLDLSATVNELSGILKRLLRADITLELRLADHPGTIMGDPSQIEQVLLNLVVNARDAMPGGGTLIIETADLDLDEITAAQLVATPGPTVRLTVMDTGAGMTDETKRRLFEPFFTTKEAGKGTGLGLATVYGIVKQSGGAIDVESAPGKGASFKLYFPRSTERPGRKPERTAHRDSWGRGLEGLKILLVEDEPALRSAFSRMLTRLKCRVTVAANGADALEAVERDDVKPDLLITDTVIPGISGNELARRLTSALPKLKVLRMSGYADPEISQAESTESLGPFLQKPFTLPELTQAVQQTMDG
jgi:PAS domain S-box-containing protein